MITTEQARHIADNMDGCDQDDLRDFAQYVGTGVRPLAQSAALFPNDTIKLIDNYSANAPIGRLHVTCQLRAYAYNKVTAMDCRARGEIRDAQLYEKICENIYEALPQWARW